MKTAILAITLAALSLFGLSAQALLISVTGPNSTFPPGTAPSIIAPPASVLNGGNANTGQQGFTERRGVLLTSDLMVDGGVVAAGTRVDSHMIFLNAPAGVGQISHRLVDWTFDGNVLGVMSDLNGNLEVASTPLLGLPAVTYPIAAFIARGLEPNTIDGTSIQAANVLRVTMEVQQPGDWIRVVTLSEIPEPATLALLVPAMLGLRRRGSNA